MDEPLDAVFTMTRFFIIGLFAVLTGCATLPIDAPPYSPAPQSTDERGLLYIYRVGAYPIKRIPGVLIDNKVIFKPMENAYTWIYLSPGEHDFKLDWPRDAGAPDLNFKIPIEAGKEHFLKITGSFKFLLVMIRMGSEVLYVEKSVAEKELKACCKFIPATNQVAEGI